MLFPTDTNNKESPVYAAFFLVTPVFFLNVLCFAPLTYLLDSNDSVYPLICCVSRCVLGTLTPEGSGQCWPGMAPVTHTYHRVTAMES